jgi:uncharacterized phiE125 gp8 family phage protein
VLVAQRWRLDVARPRDGAVRLQPRPVREVEAVRLRAADGALAVLDPADWRFDWAGERLFVLKPLIPPCVVEVDLACGYGEPEEIPESLRLAVRRLVADAFERRTGADGPPVDVFGLVEPYRDLRL